MDTKSEIIDGEVVVSIYCPVCAKNLIAANSEDVRSGMHDGFIFVHDNVPHDDTDIEALELGIN